MTLATLAACVGVLGALQSVYLFLKNMEASRQTGGPSMWNTGSGAFFDESDEQRETELKMRKNFDLARAKAIMTMAGEFASKTAKA